MTAMLYGVPLCNFREFTDTSVSVGITVGIAIVSAEGRLGPRALVAMTLQLKLLPFASGATKIGDDVPEPVTLPGEQVAV